jgi:hypothetical protein
LWLIALAAELLPQQFPEIVYQKIIVKIMQVICDKKEVRARSKINWHFHIPSSGHLCPILPALGGTKSSK